MKETEKNYEVRIQNGDFKKYLHGDGIDIGGGDDCLKLPPDIPGKVMLWDIQDGDAQYLHKIPDNSFDFVYSSHCLEHMRDIRSAFTNWLRVCRPGGVLYICVPHEIYYEKGIWPSSKNKDHKHSFTVSEKSTLPKNVVLKDFLAEFSQWIDVIEIRENLMNYHFEWPQDIDQTAVLDEKICAQIDVIVRKKEMELSEEWRKQNTKNWRKDYWRVMLPLQAKLVVKRICLPIIKIIKNR